MTIKNMEYYKISYEDVDSLMEVADRECYGCVAEGTLTICEECKVKKIKHGIAEWFKFIENNSKKPDFTNHIGNALDYPN